MISLQISPADMGGPEERTLEGTALQVATAAAFYLRACPMGACLQWQIGAGWGELYLHPRRSLADNLNQAWQELEGIGGPPACLSEIERDMARAWLPALLSAALEIEGDK